MVLFYMAIGTAAGALAGFVCLLMGFPLWATLFVYVSAGASAVLAGAATLVAGQLFERQGPALSPTRVS